MDDPSDEVVVVVVSGEETGTIGEAVVVDSEEEGTSETGVEETSAIEEDDSQTPGTEVEGQISERDGLKIEVEAAADSNPLMMTTRPHAEVVAGKISTRVY